MNSRCLFCYQNLNKNQIDFHPACSKKIFGTQTPPEIPYTEIQIEELGLEVVRSQITVTGVQPKLSLEIEQPKNKPAKFTIVGLWGGYILKPPTDQYLHLPEVEDLTLHLASIAKINTVPHSLIRLKSGNLAYITKRIDRTKNGKLHMEDMCQLTERLTEHKYHGSYEQIAKVILKFSATPGLDLINYYEQVLFSFLTGNADMHLKNFSMLNLPQIGYTLTPSYDMVSTVLVNPADEEDLALTLNAKKKEIRKNDFVAAFNSSKLHPKQQENIFKKLEKFIPKWLGFIDISFLPDKMKENYKNLIKEKSQLIFEKTF